MKGAVSSAHPLATKAGEEVLSEGGNVYDALIATSAALTVVQPHMNGLGSDFFAIVDDGDVRSINGSGYAAALADIDFFKRRGYNSIPDRGPLSSFMVPGLVASWMLLADRTTMHFSRLLRRAVQYAREGFPTTEQLRASIARMKGADEDWKSVYAGTGERLVQKDLARTLELISSDGGHSFYHGEIARAIERDMIAKGGLLRYSDLDGYSAVMEEPVSTNFMGYRFYTNPPNSQGATAAYWLRLLDGRLSSSSYYGTLISTMYEAYRWRASNIADPRYLRSVGASATGGQSISHSDTTAFSVFDGDAGISAIQSNYKGFGSGHTVHGTGINLNDRGSYFTLDREHHNALSPGKKSFHTLMAIFGSGEKRLYLGTMGGDVQPQVNMQIICNLLVRGMGMQDAISHPRFAYPASIYSTSRLYAEEGLEIEGAEKVKLHDSLFGHAHAILVGETLDKGIDPRGDGFAIL